jgi:hypothetical protein
MSEPKLCPLKFFVDPEKAIRTSFCEEGGCAWWVEEATGRSSIHIGSTGVREAPLDDTPGHCAILDIGRKS